MSQSSFDTASENRAFAIERLLAFATDRRTALKAVATAGLVPVLTSEQVAARASQDVQPVRGGTFVTIGHHEIGTLSPENDWGTVTWVAVVQMHDALYMINDQFEMEPVLAESYEASADGKTYTFRLRQGVSFHNGDAFTSADVKYTYEWIKNPDNASTRRASMELVDMVETPDDFTVVVKLSAADATFMVNTATTLIYPGRYHAEIGEEAYASAPNGTGAFKLKEWIPASHTTLVANSEYFRGRANFDEIRIEILPEASQRYNALVSEHDAANNSIWSLDAEDNLKIIDSGNFVVYKVLNNAVNHIALNNDRPALADVEVRKAMLQAVNRQAFIDDVYKGQGVLATANLSPNVTAFYNPNVPIYEFDQEAAKSTLDAAGWLLEDNSIRMKGNDKLSFTLAVLQGDTQRRPQAELVQRWFKDVGIDMDLLEAPDAIAGMMQGAYDAALFNWVYGGGNGEPDARDTLASAGASNFSHFHNDEMDDLLKQGVLELDHDKRVEIYNRVQEIVAENVPFLYFLHPQGYSFWSNSIKGLPESVLSSDNLYQSLYRFWFQR